jgi:S-adenosylmethionine hydrolase
VHLAIVDPGVGTSRRGVAVATADGSFLVGPDNGLLLPAADALGGVEAAFELTAPAYRLEPVSATFHGRDIFAPAAAHLALGTSPDRYGPRVDELIRLPAPKVDVSHGRLTADVTFTDWYGNVVLAATGGDLEASGLVGEIVITSGAGEFGAWIGTTFADVRQGELVVYVDSGGVVAIARNGGSAREVLQDPEFVTLNPKS